jgi:putative isomerase
MLIDTTVEVSKAWNTWSNRPAELVFLPLGVRLTPVLFSSRAGKATTIRPGGDLLLGRHGLDGDVIEFETRHGGSRLAFAYRKPDPYTVTGRWDALELAEWGLRYWVSLCLSTEAGSLVRYDAAEGAAVVQVGARFVALATQNQPVQVTAHPDVEALVADFDEHGYFYKGSRGAEAPALALRFELEMARDGAFAAAVADSRALAVQRAKAALAAPAAEPALPRQTGRFDGALDAVRDVMAWNTLRDTDNGRNFTATSRMWDLGGFAVWFNDQTYAALMTGVFDRAAGYGNMAAAMASATPQGNVACLLSGTDQWVDRSQAPNGAFMAWTMYLRSRERSLLDLVYEPLARNQRWWRENRDPTRLGLVSCGTSDVGDGLYKGLHFGARNETGMDNSATHDEAVYDPDTRTLSTLDVGINAVLALDALMLASIARELGREAEAVEFESLAASSRDLIRTELWDDTRGLFANRQRNGGFVRSVGPTSFYPLLCGAATPDQARRLLAHLDDPASFGGAWVIPNASREDPAYRDNVYWRGRIWPNVNFFVWHALRAGGFEAEASDLARKSMTLFDASWREQRIVAENYNAETGEAMDQGDTDPFYSWGAMLPLLGVAEVMDVNPWGGWEIRNTGEAVGLGPMESPVGPVELHVEEGVLRLRSGSRVRIETDFVGRLSHLAMEPHFVSMRLHPGAAARRSARLALPDVARARFVAATLGDRGLAPIEDEPSLAFDITEAGTGERLAIHLAPVA